MFDLKRIRSKASTESIGSDVGSDRSVDSRQSWNSPLTSPDSSPPPAVDAFDPCDGPDISSRTASWNGLNIGGFPSPKPIVLTKPRAVKSQNAPSEAFDKLPTEILDSILVELRTLHLDIARESATCTTCWTRDLCSLSLVSQKWAAAAQPKLYGSICLIGSDSGLGIKKKVKTSTSSRLKLLRRTLRENAALAEHVRDLKVPEMLEMSTTPDDWEKYLDAVASLIMSCPNLERLLGLYSEYNHEFSRLFHALATRPHLTEHVWNIVATDYELQRVEHSSFGSTPFPLNAEQTNLFFQQHANWSKLSTLAIHCAPGGTIPGHVLSATIGMLPALKHLAVSSVPLLPPNFFALLPALESLHLANLPAPSPHHLTALSSSACARSLTSLTWIHTPLLSLPLLARLMCSLLSIRRLCIIQDPSPILPNGTNIYLHPYLFSQTLQHLTWDVMHPAGPRVSDATLVLSKAIKAGGFPALETITAPCDYDGVLQDVCRPCLSLTHSTLPPPIGFGRPRGTSIGSTTSSSTFGDDTSIIEHESISSLSSSSSSDSDSDGFEGLAYLRSNSQFLSRPKLGRGTGPVSRTRSLAAARSAARSRIRQARSKPKFQVVVEDWSYAYPTADRVAGVQFIAKFDVGTYVGDVGTDIKCRYVLAPDVEGRDEVGVRVEDVLEAAQEEAAMASLDGIIAALDGTASNPLTSGRRRKLCDGRWNWVATDDDSDQGGIADGKHKGLATRLSFGASDHKERIHWEEFGIDRLF